MSRSLKMDSLLPNRLQSREEVFLQTATAGEIWLKTIFSPSPCSGSYTRNTLFRLPELKDKDPANLIAGSLIVLFVLRHMAMQKMRYIGNTSKLPKVKTKGKLRG